MAHSQFFPSVVAIPARNEEDFIGDCLVALGNQSEAPDHIVLLLNNTTDRTARIAREVALGIGSTLHVIEQNLSPAEANAGTARRLAMDAAADLIGPRGAILTTDADARVPMDWVARNLAGLRAGLDAVCGMAVIDPVDEAAIPAHLIADDLVETHYTQLLDRIDSLLDPRPADPWPRHTHRSGASIAVRTAVYRAVGGMPCVAHGEDRALIKALELRDCKIRHDPDISVTVSGRLVGRAEGGMAAAIARRIQAQDQWADDRLEPLIFAIRRSQLRAEARRIWSRHGDCQALASALALAPSEIEARMRSPWFGAAWAAIEVASPVLRRRSIAMAELPEGIREAQAFLSRLVEEAGPRRLSDLSRDSVEISQWAR